MHRKIEEDMKKSAKIMKTPMTALDLILWANRESPLHGNAVSFKIIFSAAVKM